MNILLTLHTFRGAIAISTDSLPGFVSDANAVTPRFTLDGGDSVLNLAGWPNFRGSGSRVPIFQSVARALSDYGDCAQIFTGFMTSDGICRRR